MMSERLTPDDLRHFLDGFTSASRGDEERLNEYADAWEADLARLQERVEELERGLVEFANEKRWRYDGVTWRFYGEAPYEIAQEALAAAQEGE